MNLEQQFYEDLRKGITKMNGQKVQINVPLTFEIYQILLDRAKETAREQLVDEFSRYVANNFGYFIGVPKETIYEKLKGELKK